MQKQKEFSNEYYLATYNCETQNSSLLSEVSLPLYSSRPPNAKKEKTRGLCQNTLRAEATFSRYEMAGELFARQLIPRNVASARRVLPEGHWKTTSGPEFLTAMMKLNF